MPPRGLARPHGGAGCVDVAGDLRHEGGLALEGLLVPEALPQLDDEPLSVEVAVEVEQIRLNAALDHRAAVSIGTNPHYGGTERRIEPYLLDFDGDLYGKRLVVELWERLRDEQAFESEAALVAQIARDVDATRAAVRPG